MAHTNHIVTVPQLAWWGDVETELAFPEDWQVAVCEMNGHGARRISPEEFRKTFANPIGCKPISEMARGKKNVVILFDDMSRPTKGTEIVPFVLEELAAAGVKDENIQFICALGTHGPLTAYDFAKKLGEDVIGRFNVYNHNIYENCTFIGTTGRGTPVSINSEVAEADFKVGIGSLLPHPNVGFGGGAKIILPGVASIDTILHNHQAVKDHAKECGIDADTGFGRCEHNAQLLDSQEACRMAGLDVKVDAVVNYKRDTTALFVGEPIAQYYEAVKVARNHYFSPHSGPFEVVVANCNAKINETVVGMAAAGALLPDSGGTLVMITNNPGGEVCHYLRRRFGNHAAAGRLCRAPSLSPKIKKFVLLMPFKNKASIDWFAPPESINWAKTWDEVLSILKTDYPQGAHVGVIPDATIQFF
jgi:lactate racemase